MQSYYEVLEQGYREFHFPMHILEHALRESRKKIRVSLLWEDGGMGPAVPWRWHFTREPCLQRGE